MWSSRGGLTRRDALRSLGAVGLGMTAAGAGIEALIAEAAAAAAAPGHGTLRDIEHVVILMQENRSFDHYFGTYSGVRGFSDKRSRSVFFQRGLNGKTLHPFHLRTRCLTDLAHDWEPQHKSWNGGKMNRFLSEHEYFDVPPYAPKGTGVETMGYYTRLDLPFYFGLADAFTICDMYFCSVIGPTYPNRLMSMTATIDPAGKNGGPLVETVPEYDAYLRRFTWKTMPEQLQAHGVSWKVYTAGGGGVYDNLLPFFKPCAPGKPLYERGTKPTWPGDFLSDVAKDQLPQVSWLLTSIEGNEHPGHSTPPQGEAVARAVVDALIGKPEVWRKTALFVTWDENGGFFDHVAPPTAPPRTKGEFLTVPDLSKVSEADGIRGPIGLGFRVPMLVVSPFSRGGLVCSDVFDHTSMLRFLETRFRAPVPNLSAWRRRVTGDLTSAFNFAATPSYVRPSLPRAKSVRACTKFVAPSTTAGAYPKQEKGTRKRPSGLVG